MKNAVCIALLASLSLVPAKAQLSVGPSPNPTSSAPAAPPTTTTVPTVTVQPVNIALGLLDKQKEGVQIPIANTSSSPIQVLGVQSSGDLFIESVPTAIPAGGTANITALYYCTGSTSGGVDTIRVLTSGGQIVIPVSHGRPQAVTLSSNFLTWAIGEAGSKSVTVTVSGTSSVPKAARTFGVGNTATITSTVAGTYQVTITPGNTSQANRFPVMVDLDPALPDVCISINCSVGLAEDVGSN